jgi:Fic family protein
VYVTESRFAFRPAYRYTPALSRALMLIGEAVGVIRGAHVLPAVADQLRASARVGTVHYSNLIEGNELPIVEAERAARRDLPADTRAKIELVDYVDALDFIDRRLDAPGFELSTEFLLELHKETTKGLGREDDPHFQPHHEGTWRDGTAVVVDRATSQIVHEGPPPAEVPERMAELIAWINRMLDDDEPPYVVAGVAHYAITDIHPFADGNGRVARLVQIAILIRAGVLPGRMFSFERFYAEDRDAYYAALRSVRRRTFNLDVWLEYFLGGLREEYERIAATVQDLSRLMPGGASALQLSASQQTALASLRLQGRSEFTRREYEIAADVARSTAGDDLRKLTQHGVLHVRGHGRQTRYAFPRALPPGRGGRAPGPGRRPKWTDAMIGAELREFLADRDGWPSFEEFRAAGKGALYAAMSRAGGIKRWRQIAGE